MLFCPCLLALPSSCYSAHAFSPFPPPSLTFYPLLYPARCWSEWCIPEQQIWSVFSSYTLSCFLLLLLFLLVTFLWPYLRSQADSLPSCRLWFPVSDCRILQRILNIHQSGVNYSAVWLLHGWCHVAISAHSVYTILSSHAPCRSTSCKVTLRRVHACLAVTCHLFFRQNDWDLLSYASAITVC